MAIKGKGKTKSRQVTRAPRPTPVKVKPPFFLRRWVQFTVALILGLAISVIAIWATNGLRQEHRGQKAAATDAAIAKAVGTWKTKVEAVTSTVGQVPGQQAQPLPSLTAAIASLAKGDPVKDAQTTATDAQTLAEKAATDLVTVKLYEVIRGKGASIALTNYLISSQARMAEGLALYSQAAALVVDSVSEKDPDLRAKLIEQAQKTGDLAGKIYQEGYSDYQNALGLAKIFTAPPTAPQGGAPIGVPAPTG